MKQKVSIKKIYIYLVLFLLTTLLLFFSFTWISKQKSFLKYQVTEFRKRLLKKENSLVEREVISVINNIKYKNLMAQNALKKELSRRVNIASKMVDSLVKKYKNKMSDDELKELVKTLLRDIRFENNGYFFIANLDGIEILYPIKPEYENKNILDLQDVKGNYVIREEIKILKEHGEGFVTDYWIKSKEDKKEYLKISYVKRLNMFNWYIGLGAYLDDFKNDLKQDILNQLSKRRFGRSGYIYINTYDGYSLLLNGSVNEEPINFINNKDPKGNFTTKMQINKVKTEGFGFIHYYWNKINEIKPIKKTAFVMGMDNWKWIVGAGYYHDEIDEVILKAEKDFSYKFYIELIQFVATVLFILIVMMIFIYIINRYLTSKLSDFLTEFKNASLNNELIKEDNISFRELLFLTRSINEVIKEKQKLEDEIFNKRRLDSIGVLAGGIAHDFNNLLTAILANINIAKEFDDIKEIKRILAEAETATDRARSLTQQLLTFSKGGEPILKLMELPDFVTKTTNFLLSGTDIGIKYNIPSNLWKINADKGQLGQVFENIVLNAKDAMLKNGQIEIELSNEEFNNGEKELNKYIKINISDNGVGIAPENINKIFDPYFTTKKSGNGLGLASVYSIIRKHKGLISVKSTVNKGSVFTIYLPAMEMNPLEVKLNHKVDFIINKNKILIMDDEEMILKVSSKLFSHIGFEVTTVKNGEELLDKYKESIQNNSKYDFVIMDLTIHGGMGGEEAIAKLLEIDSNVVSIVSSGYSNSPVMSDYKNYGFKGCLVKPYKLDDIKKVLNSLLD